MLFRRIVEQLRGAVCREIADRCILFQPLGFGWLSLLLMVARLLWRIRNQGVGTLFALDRRSSLRFLFTRWLYQEAARVECEWGGSVV